MSSVQTPPTPAPASPQRDGGPEQPSQPPKASKLIVGLLVLVVLLVAAAVAVFGIRNRKHAQSKLAGDTQVSAIPEVVVITPKQGAPAEEIVLPGNIQAFRDAPIYARTSGYLSRWFVDIGGHVAQGQLLAVIQSPEVDQQLQQARADLATAQSNLAISQANAARYATLLTSNSVSRQDAENLAADAQARQTMVRSAEANVQRVEELQSFERLTAPFAGVVTARNVDTGQLVNAGNTGGTPLTGAAALASATPGSGGPRELFHVASIDTLRVFVNMPQIYSRAAKPSTATSLTLSQFPGRSFLGKLVRNADAIDPATRTLLVEVDVKNPTHELLPGSYAQVHMKLTSGTPSLLLPVSALIFRGQGLQVALLEGDHAHLIPITTARDLGTQIEVASGLSLGQRVIDSPPDSLADGDVVHLLSQQPAASSTAK